MANPNKENAQLSDKTGNAMIGEQQSQVADLAAGITITWTAGDPGGTPDGAITVANGASITNAEIAEFFEEVEGSLTEINTTVNAILDVLEAHGLMADA